MYYNLLVPIQITALRFGNRHVIILLREIEIVRDEFHNSWLPRSPPRTVRVLSARKTATYKVIPTANGWRPGCANMLCCVYGCLYQLCVL